jgi:hypothetical protein
MPNILKNEKIITVLCAEVSCEVARPGNKMSWLQLLEY